MSANILPHRPIEEWGAMPIPPYAIYQQRAFDECLEKKMSWWVWGVGLGAISFITLFM